MRILPPQADSLTAPRRLLSRGFSKQYHTWARRTLQQSLLPRPPKPHRPLIARAGLFNGLFLRNSSNTIKNSDDTLQSPQHGQERQPVKTSRGSRSKLDYVEVAYLTGRTRRITQHFPSALGIDDFLHRLEIALYAYGFKSENSIAMVNLCRDEITLTLKNKIDQIFGASFSTNGLGGVLTCGVTGVSAGLSHAPISKGSGKERYVFFSFPHISIDSTGALGDISRPGRPNKPSCACGALYGALVDIQTQGLQANCKIPGVHEPLDPEFTILKQRLARRLKYENRENVDELNLVDITKVAERTITDDLEFLISKTVDPSKADYAVVTGVQIHNWGTRFDGDAPNLEWVAPTNVYVVVNGERTYLDVNAMPSLTPRQVRLLGGAGRSPNGENGDADPDVVCNAGGPAGSTVREIDPPYLFTSREGRRRIKERSEIYAALQENERIIPDMSCAWPSWQSNLRARRQHAEGTSVTLDSDFTSDGELEEMWSKLQVKYNNNNNNNNTTSGPSRRPTSDDYDESDLESD